MVCEPNCPTSFPSSLSVSLCLSLSLSLSVSLSLSLCPSPFLCTQLSPFVFLRFFTSTRAEALALRSDRADARHAQRADKETDTDPAIQVTMDFQEVRVGCACLSRTRIRRRASLSCLSGRGCECLFLLSCLELPLRACLSNGSDCALRQSEPFLLERPWMRLSF
jgi:hypothetical protein